MNGIAYQTAWKWWKAGKLPVPARQTPTGPDWVLRNGRIDKTGWLWWKPGPG